MVPCTFKENEYIVRQGEKATSFYILISGKAKVTAPNEDGEEEDIAIILPGGLTNYFGEM
jgi:CRP-like cAMP-binding protein